MHTERPSIQADELFAMARDNSFHELDSMNTEERADQPRLRSPIWDLSNEELRVIADCFTSKPEAGVWKLISPSGIEFTADSPLRCCQLESRQRIPAEVALARVILLSRED